MFTIMLLVSLGDVVPFAQLAIWIDSILNTEFPHPRNNRR